jgi:hypothetical protein
MGKHSRPKGPGKHEKRKDGGEVRSNDPTRCTHPDNKRGQRCKHCGTLIA